MHLPPFLWRCIDRWLACLYPINSAAEVTVPTVATEPEVITEATEEQTPETIEETQETEAAQQA